MIDDTALISLVQNCPCLYDKNSIEFRDNNKKNASWQAIANVLKVSVPEVQGHWRKMCDMYKKSHSDSHTLCTNPNIKKMFKRMKFIEPVVQRRSLPNMPSTSSASSSGQDFKNTTVAHINLPDKVNVEKLIKLVQQHRVLYDNKDPNYRNKEKKEEVWNSIGKTLGVPVLQCTKKWTYLRNTFRKYIKSYTSVDKSKSIKNHPYAKELKFLIPILAEKVIRQNCQDQRKLIKTSETAEVIEIAASSEDDEEEDIDEVMQDIANNHEVDSTVCDEANRGIEKRSGEEQQNTHKKLKTEVESGEVNSSVSTVELSIGNAEAKDENETEDFKQSEVKYERDLSRRTSLNVQDIENDPDMLFFRSILPDVHRMTREQKHEFKEDVLTSIKNILYA